METEPGYIVVIGASAGGMKALLPIVQSLPADIDIAVFVVIHNSMQTIGNMMLEHLQKNTSFVCEFAKHNHPIQQGHLYLAQPNRHLVIKKDLIIIGKGPAENRWRPSIDVLFRSAAASYTNVVIGVILSGMMDDGLAGMQAIKKCGGTCIIQDPSEADYPSMPQTVSNNIAIDYCLAVKEIMPAVINVVNNKMKQTITAPSEIVAEAAIAEKVATNLESIEKLGEKSLFACPDCGGGLWHIQENAVSRFRCHIGHAYSEGQLLDTHAKKLEDTLWIALRMMEERKRMLTQMSTNENGFTSLKNIQAEHAKELELHINRLKELLFATQIEEHR